MITSIRLCINHSAKVHKLDPADACVRFQPGYNALIGPNGSGKSTVLRAIASCSMCGIAASEGCSIKYVTTEMLNPRIGGIFSSREEMIQGIRSMFFSHGQGVFDSLKNRTHEDETVVLIDSPETGQDMEGSQQIYNGLLKMAENYQVIVATNSLVFMRKGNLIDLGRQSLERLVHATHKLANDFGIEPITLSDGRKANGRKSI
jgi:predicted ATPase